MEEARQAWVEMYSKTLPAAAKSRSKAQPSWPVSLDHCFARIILDNAVGVDAPWTSKLKSPAYKNMSEEQLNHATRLGQEILNGSKSIDDLNRRSLELRNKNGPKRAHASTTDTQSSKKIKTEKSTVKTETQTVETEADKDEAKHGNDAMTMKEVGVKTEESDKFDISILERTSDLTPFRREVLALLYTVPKGQWTTYKAMSDALSSSPRAVGNAMRNNPYAPMVPCHRVLASDGNIGGFGGDWGADGEHAKEKISLLRGEGVRFDGKGKAVGRPYAFPG